MENALPPGDLPRPLSAPPRGRLLAPPGMQMNARREADTAVETAEEKEKKGKWDRGERVVVVVVVKMERRGGGQRSH